MSIVVKIEGFNAEAIAKRIFNNDRVGKAAANEAARLMQKYIPMNNGNLADETDVRPWEIEYTSDYAHFQYTGKLMVDENGNPWAKKDHGKHYVSPPKDLVYRQDKNEKAGKEWDNAMTKEKAQELATAIQKLIERG